MSTPELRVESRSVVVRRVGNVRLVAAIVMAFCLVETLGMAFVFRNGTPTDMMWVRVALLLGMLASAGTLTWSYLFHDPTVATARARGAVGSVELSQGALLVHGDGTTRAFPLRRIVAGWVEPVEDGHAAVLRMKGGDVVSMRFDDIASAEALLRAAGVSAERMALRIKLPSRAEQQLAGRSAAVSQLGMLAMFSLPCLAGLGWTIQQFFHRGGQELGVLLGVVAVSVVTSAALFVRIVAQLVPPAVVVGTDGVAIQRGRWRRYLPYRHVASVQKYPLGVRVRMRDGKEILLPTWTRASVQAARLGASDADKRAARVDEARREVLHERICTAMESGGADLANAELRLLDRAGRSVARWREDLGKLLEGATYRAAGLDREALEQVLGDPGATPGRRVAAAFALSRTGDAGLRERARVATEACADQRLRVAILRAAEGEIDEVAEALETEAPAPLRRAL